MSRAAAWSKNCLISLRSAPRKLLSCTPTTHASTAKATSGCTCSTPGTRRRSTARERAALAWTEAVTKISDHHVPDEVYDEARHHFSEKELVDLTAAVIAINAWNRVAISFRPTP